MSSSGTSSKQILFTMLSVNCLLLELFDVPTKYLFLATVSTKNLSGVASVRIDINIGKERIKIIFCCLCSKPPVVDGRHCRGSQIPKCPLIPELFHVTEPNSYDLVGLSRFEGKKHPTLTDNHHGGTPFVITKLTQPPFL